MAVSTCQYQGLELLRHWNWSEHSVEFHGWSPASACEGALLRPPHCPYAGMMAACTCHIINLQTHVYTGRRAL